jgi:NAD(P)-dependent dehydrogenase (short-subunit alcohol dehydrogenase family)
MDIKGAVALIAGGGGGFGAATARRLHAAGAHVVVSDLDEAKGKAVAGELGDRALFVRTDVTDEDSVQQAVDAAAQLGPLRIAVVAHGGGGGPRVTIAPGTFLTPAFRNADPEQLDAYWGAAVPFPKRMGRADEYGQLARHIAENVYLNGETIRLDGALRFTPKGAK